MKSRPSLSRIITIWATLTACAVIGFVFYAHGLSPDELVMANTLSFQIIVALLVIGLPSFSLLIAFLLIGSLIWRRQSVKIPALDRTTK